jgi:quercetin dioxygenase-like cupin family protein
MSSPYGVPTTSTLTRPAVTDRQDGPEGKSFVLRFLPGQKLPDHRNASRLRIVARSGTGLLMVDGLGSRMLAAGEAVQLEPNVIHGLEAGTHPWEVEVHLIAGCCPGCA